MNVDKDIVDFLRDEPPGLKNSAVRWMQKRVMEVACKLPRDFKTKEQWESFRSKMRKDLPGVIGVPQFGPMKESFVRGRIRVGQDVICERVDVHVDDDFSIPAFVFSPAQNTKTPLPALVWNPGWQQDKFHPAYQHFAVRMAKQGYIVLILDHVPFGETFHIGFSTPSGMSLMMGMGAVIGWSQLAMRTAETIRCGEYLRGRNDVDPNRVAVAGLCQGGMDTWLSAALDDKFCAAAPVCSESTFAIHFAEMASYRVNGDSSPFPFGILKVCDIEHLHAAIAPRPLLVMANLPDNWWPVSGLDCVESLTRKIYRMYNAEDKVDFYAEVHEHNLTGPFADALEKFLLKYV